MSEQKVESQEQDAISTAQDLEAAKEVDAVIQEVLKLLKKKLDGKLLDVAICLNWTPEYYAKQIPKVVVETLRSQEQVISNPASQFIEVSEIMNVGSRHMLRQLISHMHNDNVAMVKHIQDLQAKPKLVVPGQ